MPVEKRDIFLCHASEDKSEVITPLVEALDSAEITYWYDQAEIRWGDSITEKVNEGLKISKYVVVILSEAFLPKKWPQRELNSALNAEASDGEVRVLPLLVGSEMIREAIIEKYPLLNDKAYIVWDKGVDKVIDALNQRLAKSGNLPANASSLESNMSFDVPIPTMKRKFTQREKDHFLRSAFGVIKAYFREGLQRLERQYSVVETDFIDVHRFKFIATIYVHGEVGSKCKIWIGGPMGSNSIAYSSGQLDIDSDNSCNGWLCITDDGTTLGFDTSGLWGIMPGADERTMFSTEEAAERFWRGFTDVLSQR